MEQKQFTRAKKIEENLGYLDKVLCFTDPDKNVCLSRSRESQYPLVLLCLENEDVICQILLEYKAKLKKEFEEL